VRVGLVTSSGPAPRRVSGVRRRARAEAPRSESVWVRLSPDEAAVVGEAAARAAMSAGAWVGDTAVGRARAEAARDDADLAAALPRPVTPAAGQRERRPGRGCHRYRTGGGREGAAGVDLAPEV
jgi:hypothetical protein